MSDNPINWSTEEIIDYFQKKFDREKIQQDIDAAAEKMEKFFQQDRPNTTVIHGDNYWATCYREACYLAKYIYRYAGEKNCAGGVNPTYFTEHPQEMARVEERWELWGDLVNNDSGLVAGIYKQKDYDPTSEKAQCPPTLVFRGTDFDDMRGVAILAKFMFFIPTHEVLPDIPVVLRYSYSPEEGKNQAAGGGTSQEEQMASRAPSTTPTNGNEQFNPEGWGVGFLGWGRDREDFKKDGYEEFKIYNKFSNFSMLIGKLWSKHYRFSANFNLELYLYAKKNGDWGNNIKQGLGYESDQYKEAIEYGREIVRKKIKGSADKRLIITGHSLGGGLASAVCCVLSVYYPDFNIQSIVFNAAGVHKNTIERELESEENALKAMANNLCSDICVRDEILTTLGAHHKKLPILGGIFSMIKREIGQYGFPNPRDISKIMDIDAISPGTAVEMAKNGMVATELPPRGAALPILFPLNKQEIMPPLANGTPIIDALDDILSSSPNLGVFATDFFEFLNDRYGEEARKNNWTPVGTYQEIVKKFLEELEPETKMLIPVMALSNAYHGMDIVIASYENMLAERALRKANNKQEQKQRKKQQKEQLRTWLDQEWQKRAEEEEQERQRKAAEEAQKIRDEQARQEEIQRRMEQALNPWGSPLF